MLPRKEKVRKRRREGKMEAVPLQDSGFNSYFTLEASTGPSRARIYIAINPTDSNLMGQQWVG